MTRLLFLLAMILSAVPLLAQDDSYDTRRRYDVLFHEAMLQRMKHRPDASFDLLTRCIELRPDAAEAWYFSAQYLAEMKKDDEALARFERAARLSPDSPTYMETLAQAYVGKEMWPQAAEVVERMYAADKGRQELLETLYQLYVQQKDYETAIGVLDRMELADGPSERTALAKSSLYIQMDRHDEAIDVLRSLAESHPNDLNYRTLYANTLLMDGRGEEALAVLDSVMADEPLNVRAQMALRTYYDNEGDTARVDSLTHSILQNPRASTDVKVYQLRQVIAESEQAGGDSTRVLACFDDALRQRSPSADIAELRAAYMDLKKMPRDTVERAFEYVLTLAPDRASSRLQLVKMAWEREDAPRIISLCSAARQYNPEEMAFYYYQGIAYFNLKDTDHALETFQNGVSVIDDSSSPEIVSDFYSIMGDLYNMKGLHDKAFAAYDSCLQWKPDNIGCLNNFAYNLSLVGKRLDEAEQMSYKTVKAEPRNATYLDTYAWILFMQQRYAEARIYIDQALQCDTTHNAVITEHAGDIYYMCGEQAEAVRLWTHALAEDPSNKLLNRKVKRKKYLKK